jgi:hypothetical protein
MNNLTIPIQREDCVGDSVSKHNFNIINLDTFICNLSSSIFMSDGIYPTFANMIANSSNYQKFASDFSNNQVSAFDIAYTATKFLSSYWGTSEFFVNYPSFISTDDPTQTDAYTINTSNDDLKKQALKYLNDNYPPSLYLDGTRLNIQFLLYNQLDLNDSKIFTKYYIASGNQAVPTANFAYSQLLDDYDEKLIGWTYQPTLKSEDTSLNDGFNITNAKFNNGIKSVRCDYSKTSITIANIVILKYYKLNNKWNYNYNLTV